MSMVAYEWQPRIIDPTTPPGQVRLEQLLVAPDTHVFDQLNEQIDDLLQSRHPGYDARERAAARRAYIGGRPGWKVGRWIYYPWSACLLHTLEPDDFHEARLARNRYKITAAEQAHLATCRIGIVGLSVGLMIARTLAMEGVGGYFRLADQDVVALSNLNRMPATLMDLGVPKVLLAARALVAVNPYLKVEVIPRHLRRNSLDEFIHGAGQTLDLIIEECDDLALKVQLRERARDVRIPVLMETSERGTLDVERFDQEPERPVLHGLLDGMDIAPTPSIDERTAIVSQLLPAMAPRTARSIRDVGNSLHSWPQLGSEIALGAASATMAARRILLQQPMASGRYQVDIENILTRERDSNATAPGTTMN